MDGTDCSTGSDQGSEARRDGEVIDDISRPYYTVSERVELKREGVRGALWSEHSEGPLLAALLRSPNHQTSSPIPLIDYLTRSILDHKRRNIPTRSNRGPGTSANVNPSRLVRDPSQNALDSLAESRTLL